MIDFSVYYIEANIICIIVFALLLLHNRFNIDRQEKQIKFDHVLVAYILYFAVDCLWAAIVAGHLPKTRPVVAANTFMIYILMGGIVYNWLEYVKSYEQVPTRNRALSRFAVLFPFALSTVALILNYIIAPQTLIDEAQNTTSLFSVYITVVPDIYMAAIIFFTVRQAKLTEDRMEKRKHLFIGFFPLIVSLGGLVQAALYPEIPIYCFTSLILMLVFYIQSIIGQVSVDPLTGLNNRGQLKRYASQKANLLLEGRHTVVVMLDVDDFKAINDNFGHAEGDKALVAIASAMKKVISSHNIPSFLGRYGGDEFIMILHPLELIEADQLIEELRAEVGAFHISISAGEEELVSERDSVESCIRRADEKLYQDKKNRKSHARVSAAVAG